MQATTTFSLQGLETVEQAISLYISIAGLQKKRWAGDTNKTRMAFSKFGKGLAREFNRRAQAEGCESALACLEKERKDLDIKRGSQLQSLCSLYYKRYRASLG